MKASEARVVLERLVDRLTNGCGKRSCQIKTPVGLGTNGRCRCGPLSVTAELRDLCIAAVGDGSFEWDEEAGP